MFERFTKPAREVVVGAVAVAEKRGLQQVTEEDVLVALLTSVDLPADLGLDKSTVAGVLDDIDTSRRRAGLSDIDADALASVGIDLDAVVDQIEANLGAGALGDQSTRRKPKKHVPFTDGCKATLAGALRQAVMRTDNEIRREHLLLGLMMRRTPVADTLAKHGVTVATVYDALDRHSA
ncbi:ClpA/ClpB-like protein [Antricoccus suffuscus]|uniref:ClpA/ClpB-like protein n=1 Tax=Antricoccus suffuscus TaxID=1629062 RepID=A0A2T1A6E1_9ACTN|nr:Clp protease N-terminal domain-containing protein [Antricoccus suffuscus]PRZ43898.1 ClpA/ClpB-like protein [Antricoccus suffuscus]